MSRATDERVTYFCNLESMINSELPERSDATRIHLGKDHCPLGLQPVISISDPNGNLVPQLGKLKVKRGVCNHLSISYSDRYGLK